MPASFVSAGSSAEVTNTFGLVSLLLWLGLSIGYHTLLEWRYGKTIGKYLVDIEVRAVDVLRPTLWATFSGTSSVSSTSCRSITFSERSCWWSPTSNAS